MNNLSRLRRRHAGVTLMELMVVMGIIGILAAIAVPTYQAYMLRTYRGAAKACMSEHAQFFERWYTTNMRYTGAVPTPGCRTESRLDTRYTIAISNVLDRTYTITATPLGAQVRDTECAVLTLDQTGARTQSGTRDTNHCWSR